MKRISPPGGRFALSAIAVAACFTASNALALGLGRLSVQSALGESLRAEIDITSMTPEEAAGLRVRIASPDAFRAAGIDYNAVLPATQAVLQRRSDGRPFLRLTSNRPVQEPFVDVILELNWSTGRLVREYTMLFDPPTMARAPEAAPTAPATPARITAAPTPTPPSAAETPSTQPPAGPAPRSAERRAVPVPAQSPGASADAAARAASTGADEYRVRPGDSLSRIAARTQRPGVSLDQMLVALFRGNQGAFIDNNMNRLRAGAVLSVPSADAATAASPAEARQVIQAQSEDFGAYRQRLAGVVPAARTDAASRQASGKVEAQVDDRRAGSATAPDKLTLSRGGVATPGSAEDRISKDREKAAADSRLAELNRNVESLARAASAPSGAPATGARAPAPPTAAPTLVAAAPAPAPVAAPTPAPAIAPAPAPAPTPSTAAPTTAAPTTAAAPAASAVAPAAARPASAPAVAAASAARAAPAAPATASSTGVMAWMQENPLLLAAGAAIVALLAGLGIYRVTQRSRRDSGETSFLESRLQPDSFFGASGGQRIDTRDAGTASSSMSYSLSQLDAIGDVDPVAEADVYLAYGRDLQAEEILKEAMRTTPDRAAIRTKLLEVYAKRRDTKGFELLASQLYALTRGQGDDWAKAQEMGALIDPDNAMYRPGGAPANMPPTHDRTGEALGASTMPQSVMPASSSSFRSGFDATTQAQPVSELDLDLDHSASSVAHAATQPLPGPAPGPARRDEPAPMDFDLDAPDLSLPEVPATPSRTPAAAPVAPMPFDLSSISLDLDLPPAPAPSPARSAPATASKQAPSAGFDLDLDDAPDSGNPDDSISRKLDLADEFRQIGDVDGARDLLQEVLAKSTGTVRARAQGMLDELG